MPYLEISPDQLAPIDSDHFVIGADPQCSLTLSDPAVAPRHLILQAAGEQWRAASLKLDALTLLNGKPLEHITSLQDGDELQIGQTVLRFHTGPLPVQAGRNYWPVAVLAVVALIITGLWWVSRPEAGPQPLSSLEATAAPAATTVAAFPAPDYEPPLYKLQVPPPALDPSAAAEREAMPKRQSCAPPEGWLWIFIQAGDTLPGLAARFDVSPQRLSQANCLENQILTVGRRLYVPQPVTAETGSPPLQAVEAPADSAASDGEAAAGSASVREPVRIVAAAPPNISGSETAPSQQGDLAGSLAPGGVAQGEPQRRICPAPEGWTYIIIEQGDTLQRLADRYDVSVEALKTANCTKEDMLFLGKRFYVPR